MLAEYQDLFHAHTMTKKVLIYQPSWVDFEDKNHTGKRGKRRKIIGGSPNDRRNGAPMQHEKMVGKGGW